mgnify:FL=1
MMTDTYQPGFSDLCGIACAIGEQEADAFLEEAGKRGSSERFLQSYAADFLEHCGLPALRMCSRLNKQDKDLCLMDVLAAMDTEFNDLDAFSSFLECIHYLPVYGLTFREAQNVLFFWPQLGYFLKMICQACRSGIMTVLLCTNGIARDVKNTA